MREGPICICPECREGEIIQLDTGLYSCTTCGKNWSLEELYETLWLDRLQKLMERKLRRQTSRPQHSEELEHIDRKIDCLQYSIQDIARNIAFLEKELSLNDCSPHAPAKDSLQVELRRNRKRLAMYQERLDRMMMFRDELEAEEP